MIVKWRRKLCNLDVTKENLAKLYIENARLRQINAF